MSDKQLVLNHGTTITFTQKKFDELKVAYNQALSKEEDQFSFYGQEIVTNYAKYLIEYLSPTFK